MKNKTKNIIEHLLIELQERAINNKKENFKNRIMCLEYIVEAVEKELQETLNQFDTDSKPTAQGLVDYLK